MVGTIIALWRYAESQKSQTPGNRRTESCGSVCCG